MKARIKATGEIVNLASNTTIEKAVLDAHRNLSDGAGLSFYNIFKAGYDYAIEEFEKNRLTACDHMTEKESEREQRFVINFLANNSRTPTFSDCIEITRQQVIDKVIKILESTDFCQYYNKEFVNEFIRKMAE